jgi:phage gp36-like protein
MQYATISDFRRLTNDIEAVEGSNVDFADAQFIDEKLLNGALTSASNKIAAAIAGLYGINLDPVPPDLVRICVRIAHWELEGHEIRDVVQKKYESAIADLKGYQTGANTLLDAGGNPVPLKRQKAAIDGYATTSVGRRMEPWNSHPPVQRYPAWGINHTQAGGQ